MDCLFLAQAEAREPADECPVFWQKASGECLQLALAECARRLEGVPVALIVPMEWASAFLVSLPTVKARWRQQALAYAVEDMLAEEVEQFHLALGEQTADGRHRVLALPRARLAGWLGRLEALGVQVAAIHIDADLLPRDGEQALLLGERGLLGGSGAARLAFAAPQWPLLQSLCAEPAILREEDAPYRLLAAGRVAATDLAQGEFAVHRENRAWSAWAPYALLLGAWLVLQLGFNLGQAWYLQRQGDAYAEASQALYRELFPEDRRIVNLRAQFNEHLASASATGGWLERLEQAARAVAEARTPLTVMQVNYSQSQGDLALQVRARDFADLEQLRQRLVKAGLSVQLGSANREDEGVMARVVLGGGA